VLFHPIEEPITKIEERLRVATAPSCEMFRFLVCKACPRLAACNPTMLAQFQRLLEAGAYTDAALWLVEAELPAWKLRRVTFDHEWHCFLSRTPWAPHELDDLVEANHASLPLAILSAFVAARRTQPIIKTNTSAVPLFQTTTCLPVCCDNFA
jgi:hypothetical protein